MNWVTIGAIALVAIALLGIGSTVVNTGPVLGVAPGVALSGYSTGTVAEFHHNGVPHNPGDTCTPGVPGCE